MLTSPAATVRGVEPIVVVERPPLDPESQAWLAGLRAEGRARNEAVARLHALLLKAARFELNRRRGSLAQLRADVDDLAQQCADDACVTVLARLNSFRGDSRFTTWAYKFALLDAAVKVRRLAWQGREVPLEPEAWAAIPDGVASPERALDRSEAFAAVREGIRTALTPHQRNVLLALAVNGVPIDVLAERLQTTRGALYKTLHDARRTLRAYLEERE